MAGLKGFTVGAEPRRGMLARSFSERTIRTTPSS
jgi:hypothetical protein